MGGLLEGLRVVDMGHVVAVPCAGCMMADWGAEVIKVEPISGEMSRKTKRALGKSREVEIGGNTVNWAVELHNRGKKGLAVDLKQEAGRQIVYRLVETADIFMTNYLVKALARLKMDYTTLSRINPGIVYGLVTGYGRSGPDKDERGFDITAAWARSGAQHLTSDPNCPPPMQRGGMMDKTTAAYLVAGMLAALRKKDRTGRGQEVEISLYQAAVWSISLDIQSVLVDEPLPVRDRTRAASPLGSNFCTQDDRWIILLNPDFDETWPRFCLAIGRPELANDPRFNTQEAMEQHCEQAVSILDEIFASKKLAEWERRLKENNVVYGRVQTPFEVVADPQAIENHFFTRVAYPGGGEMEMVNTPVKFSEDPASIKAPAPKVGENTDDILLQLGCTREDVARLRADHVIA